MGSTGTTGSTGSTFLLDCLPEDLLTEFIPFLDSKHLQYLADLYRYDDYTENQRTLLKIRLKIKDKYLEENYPHVWYIMSDLKAEAKWNKEHPVDPIDKGLIIEKLDETFDDIFAGTGGKYIEYLKEQLKNNNISLDDQMLTDSDIQTVVMSKSKYRFNLLTIIQLVIRGASELFKLWMSYRNINNLNNYSIDISWRDSGHQVMHRSTDYSMTTYTFLQWATYHSLDSILPLLEPYFPPDKGMYKRDTLQASDWPLGPINKTEYSPLTMALMKDNYEIAMILVRKHGYDPSIFDNRLLIEAILRNDLEAVVYMLDLMTEYDVNDNFLGISRPVVDPSLPNNRPFIEASAGGNVDIMKALLDHGVDPSKPNSEALLATIMSSVPIVSGSAVAKNLKSFNIKTSIKILFPKAYKSVGFKDRNSCNEFDYDKSSPLDLSHINLEAVFLLLDDYRVDPSIYGNLALKLAQHGEHELLSSILLSSPAVLKKL